MKGSLRGKIFRMSIILIAVAVLLFAVLGIFLTRHYADLMEQVSRQQNQVIMETMSDSMREMATGKPAMAIVCTRLNTT